jgi:hypothetical protein
MAACEVIQPMEKSGRGISIFTVSISSWMRHMNSWLVKVRLRSLWAVTVTGGQSGVGCGISNSSDKHSGQDLCLNYLK